MSTETEVKSKNKPLKSMMPHNYQNMLNNEKLVWAIKICDEWKDSENGYKNFVNDLGIYTKGLLYLKLGKLLYNKENCIIISDIRDSIIYQEHISSIGGLKYSNELLKLIKPIVTEKPKKKSSSSKLKTKLESKYKITKS